MTFAGELSIDVQSTIDTYGQQIRFRYFTTTLNSGSYDSEAVFTSGTNSWVNGLVQPIGKSEIDLVQQGLLKTNDLKVYVGASVSVSGTWRVGIGGSPTPTNEYTLTEENLVESPMINGSRCYTKMFVRRITTGSLFGE